MKNFLYNLTQEKLIIWLTQLITLIITFLAPLKGVVLSIFFLIIIDTVSGIYASFRQNIPITSKRARDIIGKISGYLLAIIASQIFQQSFGIKEIDLVKIVSFIIASVEVKSILENTSKIVGWNLWIKIKSVLSGKKSLKDTLLEDEDTTTKDNSNGS